jgi:hypothetical protein
MALELMPHLPARKHFKQRVLLGLIGLLIVFATRLAFPSQAQANANALPGVSAVLTDSNVSISTTSMGILGVNVPQYVPAFLSPAVPQLLKNALGWGSLRFPGGSNADYYNWATNGVDQQPAVATGVPDSFWKPAGAPLWPFNPYADPSMNFDAFMKQAALSNAQTQADIVVNYGTGTAQEAANWVQYANANGSNPNKDGLNPINPGYTSPTYAGHTTGHFDNIKYWEIGNEVYGDGTYGYPGNPAFWEYDHTKGPQAYANAVMNYAKAMRAVGSPIQIGAVLTMPGNFPDDDSIKALLSSPSNPYTTAPPLWDQTVLNAKNGTQSICNTINFVSVHWYAQQPGSENDAALLASPAQGIAGNTPSIPAMMKTLRQRINTACPTQGPGIAIRVTEANSVNSHPGKQTVGAVNALFLEDAVQTFLENGAQNVDWWSLHNGFYQPAGDVPGQASYGTDSQGQAEGPYDPYNPALQNFLKGTPNNEIGNLYPQGTNIGYGDFGLLSEGDGGAGAAHNGSYTPFVGATPVSEPIANTPFPSYYGMEMVAALIQAGGNIITATTDNSLVIVHSVFQGQRGLPPAVTVMVINEDPNPNITGHTVTIHLPPGWTTKAQASAQYLVLNPGQSLQQLTQNVPAGLTSVTLNVNTYATGFIYLTL